ncbi:MAG: PHP domain-containing protein [Melioribacteraceae bacterium]|jgi:predicted metal-dependent phosphoesterase TrpH|nr:phosphatase [Ignavibacteriota bacterium]MBZ0183834.1 PHP domain-containing protein [Melioribacteraceae bacterium]
MISRIDLHTHTVYSDGSLTPKELLDYAKSVHLTTISITDHDTIDAIPEAKKYGKEIGVEVIPGLEISTDIEDKEVHLLGYFIDINDEELKKYLRFFREERFFRAKRMIKKLNDLNIDISIDDVLKIAKNSAIGRPHIAAALLEKGYINNFYEAFNKYIGDNGPAYERKIHVSAQSAVKLIADAGGLCFIAHPGHLKESILTNLINAGIDGIEVIHPSHNDFQVKFYRGIVNQYCLLESGGSDFHGSIKGDERNLGKYYISKTKFENMKKMLSKSERSFDD